MIVDDQLEHSLVQSSNFIHNNMDYNTKQHN